jgi:hypothetical protein
MSGFTKEEQFLNELGSRSFLRFWSWPNLFRDQCQANGNGDGKEICDLTVIFDNEILLFSDKKIEFNITKPLNIAWSRWAKKAIKESVKQVQGAKRWITNYPDRVYIDSQCTKHIPINLPESSKIKFHHIVVCHGAEEELAKRNADSSFSFDNNIAAHEHWDASSCVPFTIGNVSEFEDEFFHIFSEATIKLILEEFDTVTDLILYLTQRALLLNNKKHIKVKSESDIVQLFYANFDKKELKNLILNAPELKAEVVEIDKGGISKLYSNPIFVAKKINDEQSYFWDDLIESFSHHILNGTTEFSNWTIPSEIEPSLRLIAKCGRFERRVLSQSFFEFYDKAEPKKRGTRVIFDPINIGQAFIFLLLPFDGSFSSTEEYRTIRRQMIEDYCLINKYKAPNITRFIGIAAKTRDTGQTLNNSFFNEDQDFIFLDTNVWTDDDNEQARKIHDQYVSSGLLAKRQSFMITQNNFPTENHGVLHFDQDINLKGRDRNKPCICGSGKKIKKCCGRE